MFSVENNGESLAETPRESAHPGGGPAEKERKPRVSVVIPTYDSAAMLKEAIESVMAQTYSDFEVIVVDDGSKDDAECVARRFGDRVLYFRQNNQGAGAARNAGIRKASGEYIAFLDSDDLWSSEKLAEQIPLLDVDPRLGLVYSDWAVVSDNGAIEDSYLKGLPATSGYVFDELVQCGFILTSGVVVRRACLNEVGDFDNSLSIAQDYDLWLRICYRWRAALVNKPLVSKRSWNGSLSSNLQKTAVERIALFEKALGTFRDLPAHSRRLIKRQLSLNHWDIGYAYFDQFLFKEARNSFLSSLSCDWRNGKSLCYLAASFLPERIAKAVRELKRAMS